MFFQVLRGRLHNNGVLYDSRDPQNNVVESPDDLAKLHGGDKFKRLHDDDPLAKRAAKRIERKMEREEGKKAFKDAHEERREQFRKMAREQAKKGVVDSKDNKAVKDVKPSLDDEDEDEEDFEGEDEEQEEPVRMKKKTAKKPKSKKK